MISAKFSRDLAPTYDAVVIGSGYGGGVAACRLAHMGLQVAVLEQGRNWQPGEFPTATNAQRKLFHLSGRLPNVGKPTGLYQLTGGKGLTVFAATGLGGGSLINAGIALRPDIKRLRKFGWPDVVLSDGLFEAGMARAERMLGAHPVPQPGRFAKFDGMVKAAAAAGVELNLPAMTIAHQAGANAAGVVQDACLHCGDCWSGCNAHAKGTIGDTYMADAVRHGAEVFCESRVESIARIERHEPSTGETTEGWEIRVRDLSGDKADRTITTKTLVLAAGTLGTNEILLKAQRDGLALSQRLGRNFSANGDDLVLAGKLDKPVNAIATGNPSRAPADAPKVGPHSMSYLDLGDESGPLCMHDGTMLPPMAALAPVKAMLSLDFKRAMELLPGGIYGPERSRIQLFYIVGHDSASGEVRLHKDRVVVDWPDYSKDPARVRAEEKARKIIEDMGGKFQPNPFAMTAFGGNRIIAHPLGGCAMAETVEEGVVAPDGRVFNPGAGRAGVYDGLYVCDGAAIPTSVGVSPLLTISALAERVMVLAERRLSRRPETVDIKGDFETVRAAVAAGTAAQQSGFHGGSGADTGMRAEATSK